MGAAMPAFDRGERYAHELRCRRVRGWPRDGLAWVRYEAAERTERVVASYPAMNAAATSTPASAG